MKTRKINIKSSTATIQLARPVVADQDTLPNVVDMLETSLRAANEEIMTLRGENSDLKNALAQHDASAIVATVVASEEGAMEHTGPEIDLQCSQKETKKRKKKRQRQEQHNSPPIGWGFMGKIKRAFSWK
ncbi:hypothetical protein BGZ58_001735 [Dissophora ornata]|nr:hypothetical protein BGZ58_001735 [Dissophora ornata]